MVDPRHVELTLFHRAPRHAAWHEALVFATSAIVFLTADGCGRDSPLEPSPGSASLTTSGAVSLSGGGPANWNVSGGRESTFTIDMYHFSEQHSVIWELQIYKNNSQQLGVATYSLGPQSDSRTNPTASLVYYTGDPVNPTIRAFNSTSGQLVITSASQSEIRGTFAFAATEYGGTGSITVNGSFDACWAVCE